MHTTIDPTIVPEKKLSWGYRYAPDKFGVAGLTPFMTAMGARSAR